jgi:hypothetical protein
VRRLSSAGIAAVIVGAVLALLALAGCGSGGSSTGETIRAPDETEVEPTPSPGTRSTKGREEVTLAVPSSLAGGTLESPHQVEVPKGWTMSVWARPEGARMMAVTPKGTCW